MGFVKSYIQVFAYSSVTTEEWKNYLFTYFKDKVRKHQDAQLGLIWSKIMLNCAREGILRHCRLVEISCDNRCCSSAPVVTGLMCYRNSALYNWVFRYYVKCRTLRQKYVLPILR